MMGDKDGFAGCLGCLMLLIPIVFIVMWIRKKIEESDKEEINRQKEQEENKRTKWLKEKKLDFRLTPNEETFTEEPLSKGEWFKIVIYGTYNKLYDPSTTADACYKKEHKGLSSPYQGIFFNLESVSSEPFEEDHHLHRYTFVYYGTGNKLMIFLKPPWNDSQGSLSVDITPLSSEEIMINMNREEDRKAKKEKEQKQKKEENILKKQQEIEQTAKQWYFRVKAEKNFLNPEYRKNLAEYKREEIFKKKNIWFKEYQDVMINIELYSYLKEKMPDILEWFEARQETVLLAEKIEVLPPKKLSPEEYRQKAINRIIIDAKDKRSVQETIINIQKEDILSFITQTKEIVADINARDDLSELEKEEIIKNLTEGSQTLISKEEKLKELL